MKTLRKVLSFAVSLMMVFSLMTVVNADTTKYTISVPSTDTHTYKVYQIMTGEYTSKVEDGVVVEEVLSNAYWGKDAKNTGVVSGADMDTLKNLTGTEAEKAATIAGYVNMGEGHGTDVTNSKSLTVEPGYYLIVDNGKDDMTGDSYSLYIVQVAGDVIINAKKGHPTVEKKVYEESKGWQDAADYDIGDHVPFALIATLPNMDNYKNYYVQFDDTFCAGLTYDGYNTTKVYVVHGADYTLGTDGTVTAGQDTTVTEVTNSFTKTFNSDNNTLFVTNNNVKTIAANGDKVIVTYTATLNTNAVIGTPGNFNEIKLEYSNNPNDSTGGTPSKGETPTDKVVVFTYEIDVNKTDASGASLEGAGFTLYKQTGTTQDGNAIWTQIGEEITGVTIFTFKGVDSGEYKLVETKVPTGYNKADDVTFKINATYVEGTNPTIESLTVTPSTANFTVKKWEQTEDNSVDANLIGKFNGVVETTIVNKTGSTLPETGGMGTTVLYVGGSLLMLGATILLVSKKRMSTIK